ncbi:MAG: glycosyltransferase family 9 protein [Pseudobacter sp.]|uniref:glycosyltransferase family 9 protein n=1 Tax=Pseudobacter sp. TaxID=2045420 RepID=UPI003F802DB9
MIPLINPHPRIAILRALQLGDLLCSIPAIRALRQAYPYAEITLLGLPWSASLLKRFPKYFDRHIHFPGYPGLPEQPFNEFEWNDFVSAMQQQSFDLIIQMQGNGSIVNELLPELGASNIAGFKQPGLPSPWPHFMNYPTQLNEVLRHMALMNFLDIPANDPAMEFPVTEKEKIQLKEVFPFTGKPYVCVHPGSRAGWRQWPPAHFAMLGDFCADAGYQVVFTGTKEEQPIIAEVQKWMKQNSIDLSGKTDLGTVAALIDDAALLIANCTGVSHIAAATHTPSLIISMDGEPNRWGPLDRNRHTVIDWLTHPSLRTVYETLINKLEPVTAL